MTDSLSFARQGDKQNSNFFEEYLVRLLEERDRSGLTDMIHEIDAIMITVDTAVLGRRERDVRRGLIIPPEIGPAMIIDGILHPAWTLDFITHEPLAFANVVEHADKGVTDAMPMATRSASTSTGSS